MKCEHFFFSGHHVLNDWCMCNVHVSKAYCVCVCWSITKSISPRKNQVKTVLYRYSFFKEWFFPFKNRHFFKGAQWKILGVLDHKWGRQWKSLILLVPLIIKPKNLVNGHLCSKFSIFSVFLKHPFENIKFNKPGWQIDASIVVLYAT